MGANLRRDELSSSSRDVPLADALRGVCSVCTIASSATTVDQHATLPVPTTATSRSSLQSLPAAGATGQFSTAATRSTAKPATFSICGSGTAYPRVARGLPANTATRGASGQSRWPTAAGWTPIRSPNESISRGVSTQQPATKLSRRDTCSICAHKCCAQPTNTTAAAASAYTGPATSATGSCPPAID